MTRPLLGYWDIRGLCEPIRLVLHQAGVDFEDRRYAFAAKNVWYEQDMPTLGLDFPNLPYYVDGEVKLTQSVAVLRHVARKHGLAGKPQDLGRIEMAEQQAIDLRTSLATVVHNHEKFDELKVTLLEGLPAQLDKFTKFLGGGHFVAGDYVTYADFLWYESLDFYAMLYPGVFDKNDVISSYLKRIKELPNIAKYMASPVYKRLPFSPRAKWGGDIKDL
ncbi:Glutathione S-transferase Mu 1 [Halotydeus destructor]|nr:Glutathione S-transferase Mu 1 [Halotydeus destructor]